MCGIAGWIEWNNDIHQDRAVMDQMVSSMVHRGPDSSGIWESHRAVLGHCRLAVMDPVGGKQPMAREWKGKTGVISYNGELYNQGELRRELTSRGHSFQTANSDTETLLLAYLEWGTGCLARLNGIFAFAIWDPDRETLFMARDRVGVKPLFYMQQEDLFLFASEIKALLQHPRVHPKVDARGWAEVLVMGPGRTPGQGVFEGISELKPGYMLTANRHGLYIEPYWQLQSRLHGDDQPATVDHIRELLDDIVQRQLIADVPQCTLLSGGLDSSLITALAARDFGPDRRLHTYCIRYQQEEGDLSDPGGALEDYYWADQAASRLNTVHHEVVLRYQDLHKALRPAMLAGDLPGMVDVDTSLLLLCQEIRKDFIVALSGECADEIFGGYPWFHSSDTGFAGFPWMKHLERRMETLAPDLVSAIRPLEYQADCFRDAVHEVPALEGEDAGEARQRALSYLTITRFMPTLLQRKDRMSMAWGLEIRVPFSDHRLVEYAWNLPWSLKTPGGVTKGILRQAAAGLLPADLVNRRKSPFPKTVHPGYRQAVASDLREVLSEPDSPLKPIVNIRAIDHMIESPGYFHQPWFGQLMSDAQWMAYLIQVDAWMRTYKVSIRI